MDSNLEIIKVLFENSCQRIVECKDLKNDEYYIYNTIINQQLIKLIDIVTLNNLKSNIIKCYKTQDRLYIVTKPHELNNQYMLKDFIDKYDLTLKQQYMIAEQLINIFIDIYNTTDLLQYKIINFKNLSIDESYTVYVNGYFEFKDEFDLSDNFTYKNIGHIIHYLFSKEEIVDYNISDKIPPDVLKIIVKCLTREYFHPKDLLKEFKNSPLYDLINFKKTNNNTSFNTIQKNDEATQIKINGSDISKSNDSIIAKNGLENDDSNNNNESNDNIIIANSSFDKTDSDKTEDNSISQIEENISDSISENLSSETEEGSSINEKKDEDNNQGIIDIYLNSVRDSDDINKEMKGSDGSKLIKFLIPAFIIVFVVSVSAFLLKSLYSKENPDASDAISDSVEPNQPDSNNGTSNEGDNNNDNNKDENKLDDGEKEDSEINVGLNNKFSDYLSEELLQKIKYTGSYAVIDTEDYNNGSYSLAVENTSDDVIKSLFAVIDFSDEKFRLMNNNQICVSAKFKAKKDVNAKLYVEVYKDGKLLTEDNGTLEIYNDVWSQKLVNITINDFDRVNLYIEYSGQNKVWIDSINADITK